MTLLLIKSVPFARLREPNLFELPQRLQPLIMPEPISGCWIWIGSVTSSGYGQWNYTPDRTVHRFIYKMFIGSIPDGMVLDHLCRLKTCVNPFHLEIVTQRENSRRGLRNQYTAKLHCPQGHPYSGNNLSIHFRNGRSYRMCKECGKQSMRRVRARKKGSNIPIRERSYSFSMTGIPEHIILRRLAESC
jgi:hypothetical protein